MRQVRLALLVTSLALAAGCSTPPPAPSAGAPAMTPVDFSLDVAVLGSDQETLAADRYVLFPDGSLHCGRADDRGARWLPQSVRQLSRWQMDELWAECRRLGLLDPEAADPIVNPNLVSPPAEGSTWLIVVTGGDRRWNFVRSTTADDGSAAAAPQTLVDRLATLAWAEELRQRDTFTAKRYDFGPDPYAPYRPNPNPNPDPDPDPDE